MTRKHGLLFGSLVLVGLCAVSVAYAGAPSEKGTNLAGAEKTPAQATQALGDTLKKLAIQWRKVNTLSADLLQTQVTVMKVKDKEDSRLETTTTGRYYYSRKGEKDLVRQDLHTSKESTGPQTLVMLGGTDTWTTIVGDGTIQRSMAESSSGTTGSKTNQRPTLCLGGIGALLHLSKDHELKLIGEETFNGRQVYAIESIKVAKETSRGGRRTIHYYDKENGALVRRVSYSTRGEVRSILEFTHVEINPPLASDLFVLDIPATVVVVDRTKTPSP